MSRFLDSPPTSGGQAPASGILGSGTKGENGGQYAGMENSLCFEKEMN